MVLADTGPVDCGEFCEAQKLRSIRSWTESWGTGELEGCWFREKCCWKQQLRGLSHETQKSLSLSAMRNMRQMELEIWGLHEKKADDVKHHLFFLENHK